jgi:hypothetical protein
VPAPRLPFPDDLRRRPFTVAEAVARGLTAKQLRHPDLRAPHRGVRVPAHLPDDLRTRCLAAALLLPPGHAFEGATAAALHGLPLPSCRAGSDPLEVSVPVGAPRPRVDRVRVRAGRGAPAAAPGRLVVATPARAWAALGELAVDDLVVLGDAVVRRRPDSGDLRRALDRTARLTGRARLEQALALVRTRVDSPQETRTRLLLVRAGVPEPVPNRDAYADGGWLAVPDLSWPQVRVALEYLGDVHRVQRGRWRRDVRRREVLEDHGWKVLLATADDLERYPHDLVARVTSTLRERGMRW